MSDALKKMFIVPWADLSGLVQPGNLDLNQRPVAAMNDGSYGTVYSTSFGGDQGETLVPQIAPNGVILTPQQALGRFQRTGENLGTFTDPAAADAYGQTLHEQQAQQYGMRRPTATGYPSLADLFMAGATR